MRVEAWVLSLSLLFRAALLWCPDNYLNALEKLMRGEFKAQ